MKKKWVGTVGAMLMAAAMIFSGSTAAFADGTADNQAEDTQDAYVEDIHGQDEIVNKNGSIEELETGVGYEIRDCYTITEGGVSKEIDAPEIFIYTEEINKDLNELISELIDRPVVKENAKIGIYSLEEGKNFTITKSNLDKIKAKNMVLEVAYITSDYSETNSAYVGYTFTKLDNITGDYTPSFSINTDTKAVNTLKSLGVSKFYTVTLNEKYGSKSLGDGEVQMEMYHNIGNFDFTNGEHGYPLASNLHSYYYIPSTNRFAECSKEDAIQGGFIRVEADGQIILYFEGYNNFKTTGTYVITQGELPKAALMDTYTGLVNEDGNWLYYNNGKADQSYTGLCKYNDAWWYVKNGKVDFSYTGLYKYNGTWWYLNGGKINFSATGLCKYNGTWWYVKNGKIDFSSTTLCKYNGTWWYVSGGKVNFGATGLCKYNGSWWYVSGGKVNFSAIGLCKYNGTWWYVKNGKIDFSATTLCKYNGNWFYVNGGKVSFTTTLCKYNGTWFYVNNGVVNFNKTTLVKYNGNWFAVTGGKVAWGYTGKINYNGVVYNVVGGVVRF